MAQYAPKTWTTGETITAAELNAIEQAAAAAIPKADADAAYDAKGAATTAQAAAVQRANHTGTQAVTTIAATGTPSSSTYLRGDGAWATPAGGGGAVASVNGKTGTVVLAASDVGADPSGVGTVLAERVWDLTGYKPPQTTSTSAVRMFQEGVTFTAPASGWVRIILTGDGWTSGDNVSQHWSVLTATDKVLHSQMAVQADAMTGFRTYVLTTNMKGNATAIVPGETLTFYWGWQNAGVAGTAFLDNSVASMRVEAARAPSIPPLGSLTTPENVPTVNVAASGSQTASWSATPQVGDLLLAVFMCNIVNTSWVLPSGWTIARAQRVGTAGARYVGICYKVAGAGEPTSVTFTGTGAGSSALHIWSKRGFTGTPTLDQATGVSLDSYTSGTNLDSGVLSAVPSYGVSAIGGGATLDITNIGNSWASLWDDGSTLQPIEAGEKSLGIAGLALRLQPAVSTAAGVGAMVVTFTGV